MERVKKVWILEKCFSQPITMAKNDDGMVQQDPVSIQQRDEIVSALGDQPLEKIYRLIGVRRFSKQGRQSGGNPLRGSRTDALQVLARALGLAERAEIEPVVRNCAFGFAQQPSIAKA